MKYKIIKKHICGCDGDFVIMRKTWLNDWVYEVEDCGEGYSVIKSFKTLEEGKDYIHKEINGEDDIVLYEI